MYLYTEITIHDFYFLLRAMGSTLLVTFLAIAIGTALGFVVGLIRSARVPVFSQISLVYIELLRNSPLVTQLFLVYFGLPMVTNISPSAFQAAVWTLGLNTGAFIAVIVHASIDSVPKGQWEAAYAGGLTYWQTLRVVILPQAIRAFIPPAVGLYVSQLQVSSLIALIGFVDLTRAGQILTERTFKPFLVWFIVAMGYFAISYPLSKYARLAEKKVRILGKIA